MGTKRPIHNYQGEFIGEIELPSDTSEEQWTEKLAVYATPPVKIIPEVTPRQIKQALVLSGIPLATIESALNSLPEPSRSLAIIEWQDSKLFERNRPLVRSVGQMLGWTDAQLDNLWLFAGTLV